MSLFKFPRTAIQNMSSVSSDFDANAIAENLSQGNITSPWPSTPCISHTELIDATNPSTYNNVIFSTVCDVNGKPISLACFFQEVADNTWNVYVTANGECTNGVKGEDKSAMRPIASLNYPANGGGSPTAVCGGSITAYSWSPAGDLTTTTAISNGIIYLPSISAVSLSSGRLSNPTARLRLNMSSATQYGTAFANGNMSADGNSPKTRIVFNIDRGRPQQLLFQWPTRPLE
jgi:flagellar hook protein FlgE